MARVLAFLAALLCWLPAGAAESFDPNTAIFIGSSTMGHWKERMSRDFAGIPNMNLGENGTTYDYLLANVPAWAKQYPAKRWVIYSGDNDLNGDHPRKPEEVIAEMKQTIGLIQSAVPGAEVFVISLKCRVTPQGEAARPRIEEANRQMQTAAASLTGVTYVDTYSAMRKAGADQKQFFDDDGIHLNGKGYDLWRGVLRPYLEKKSLRRASPLIQGESKEDENADTVSAN